MDITCLKTRETQYQRTLKPTILSINALYDLFHVYGDHKIIILPTFIHPNPNVHIYLIVLIQNHLLTGTIIMWIKGKLGIVQK